MRLKFYSPKPEPLLSAGAPYLPSSAHLHICTSAHHQPSAYLHINPYLCHRWNHTI